MPLDLDLHLFSFDRKTLALVTHCYFYNKAPESGLEVGERLHLDVDHMHVCIILFLCVCSLQRSISIDTVCNLFSTMCSLIRREMDTRP
jgi:hypothetical protein